MIIKTAILAHLIGLMYYSLGLLEIHYLNNHNDTWLHAEGVDEDEWYI